jgi:hypothetical protein
MIIVGNNLWHFDGTNSQKIHTIRNGTGNSLDDGWNGNSIFAFSQTEWWLVYGGIAMHTKDGAHFDDIRPGSSNACWGSSPNDVFIVGNGGQIHHWDGTSFTQMNSGTTKDLRSVWGTSSSDVWACGYNSSTGGTILLHFDGNNWDEDPISISKGINATGGFDGVWACDSSGHKIVVTSGAILIRKTDNLFWRSDSGLIPNRQSDGTFIGIGPSGNNVNDFMAIGPWGFLAHWNGKTWKQYLSLFDYGNPDYYTAAFSMKDNTACALGQKSGQAWMAVGQRK